MQLGCGFSAADGDPCLILWGSFLIRFSSWLVKRSSFVLAYKPYVTQADQLY